MGRRPTLLSALALVVACGAPDAAAGGGAEGRSSLPLAGPAKDGVATFYDADGSGNCSFDASPGGGDIDVTALALPEYASSASCGACLQVTGPDATVTVRVVDSCPGCAGNGVNLDLSASAFAKIAKPDRGRIPISYALVACPVTGSIAYHFKDGSSRYWTAIQIRNHKLPIAKLEYRSADGYVEMKREDYNYFVAANGVGDQPNGLALRVTATDGQTLEDVLPLATARAIPADATLPGTKQFD